MRRYLRRVAAITVAGSSLYACGARGSGDDGCPSAVALGEATYLECTDAIGLEVVELQIDVSGDIGVRFGEGATEEQIELALRECEPAMQEALVLGRLACETTDVGHPAPADAIAAEVARAGDEGFSGAVAVIRDGAPLWDGAVGMADREAAIANTTATAFDCGSIMKVMTAAAIYQLEAEGSLSRGAELASLLDGVPADKAVITVEQIVGHRAGFHEFHDTEGDFEPLDRSTALARILGQELLFVPGSDEAYSNSGYTLLAAIVEDTAGVPFAEYLRTRLFEPAAMDGTGLYGEGRWAAGEAAIGYGELVFGCNSPGCWAAPSWALVGNGGLVSTVDDLVRWMVALEGGVPFDVGTRDAFRREVLGYSVVLEGDAVYGFSGRNDFGFGAMIGEVPARGAMMVVASNAAGELESTVLAAQLLQMSTGALLEPQ